MIHKASLQSIPEIRPLSVTDEDIYRGLMIEIVIAIPMSELHKIFIRIPIKTDKDGVETFEARLITKD